MTAKARAIADHKLFVGVEMMCQSRCIFNYCGVKIQLFFVLLRISLS